MKRSTHFLVLLLGVIFTQASAQVATGTPAFGSFGGGPFDIVNLGNMNVHFSVPIQNKAGRGTPFSYNLAYDSTVWTPATVSGSKVWQPAANWGWQGQTEVSIGYITETTTQTKPLQCNPPDPGSAPTTLYNFSNYRDKFGINHHFFLITSLNGCTGVETSKSATAADGSGYTLNATGPTATITTPGGAVISPPINAQAGSGTFTDPNGNEITVSGAGSFTDTLGTTALSASGSGTPSSPLKFGYKNYLGNTVYVTVNYAPFNVKTNFKCTGVSEYSQSNVSLVSNIQLPDNSKYIFAYEPTPGNSGHYTGRLLSVQLPSGGSITYGYNYSDATNGIICADGTADGLTRTVSTRRAVDIFKDLGFRQPLADENDGPAGSPEPGFGRG